MLIEHPWQKGPTELIKYAIEHLYRDSEFDQRVAFLLLDIGVETTMKVYLNLPEEKACAKTAFSERKKAITKGNFHCLVKAIRDAVSDRLIIDLTHIQYFHSIRNKLYHESDSITIPHDVVKEYADNAVKLLKILLDVDLTKCLEKDIEGNKDMNQKLDVLKTNLVTAINELHDELELCIERIEPKLLLPSFKNALAKIDFVEPIKGIWGLQDVIKSTFGVDLIDYLSENDKDIVRKHLQEKHGNNYLEFVSIEDKLLDVISGFIDWAEFDLVDLPIGDYKVHNIVFSDFMDADLYRLYFKIVLGIISSGRLDLLNAYQKARQYTGLDTNICGSADYIKDDIMDKIENYNDVLNNIKNICNIVGEWRNQFSHL
ncbi:MAG: hypothetical protein GX887_06320 [Firmicutes bacterium]|nr:hypothetical protein [Bacillota bacterium]